ncbi:hypothetical protein ACLMJK_007908 [Lecanora helva]
MPGVEVLPNSTSIKTPGWALVPDTGHGPSQLAAQPTTKRGRAGRASNISGGDTTARQENAVLKHLADLDRDNHRDVQIPVPKDTAARGAKKTTPNVRRILMSQKTFANHLADEEAALAQQQGGSSMPPPRIPALKSSRSTAELKDQSKSGAPAKDPLDDEPLLQVNVPSAPSEEELEALTSAPPLSYNAARSAPPPPHKPRRYFCEICGYWGSVKCMKCGARVCGLECKGAHDDGRCLKFYA